MIPKDVQSVVLVNFVTVKYKSLFLRLSAVKWETLKDSEIQLEFS